MNGKKSSKVNVCTRAFENTYGHKPRGFGFWIFKIIHPTELRWDLFQVPSSNYGKAKAEAVKEANNAEESSI